MSSEGQQNTTTNMRMGDNEANKINWEPIKTNIECCELYLLAKEREQEGGEFLRG